MKRTLLILLLLTCPMLWSCSSDSGSPDPLAQFRVFAEELRQMSFDALTQTGRDLSEIPDGDPRKVHYLIAMEDLLIGQTYSMRVFNDVIHFSIRSHVGSVYTNTDRDATIDTASGRFQYELDTYIFLEEAATAERVLVTFTWMSSSDRWLIIGLRGGDADQEPEAPWFRQEGEIVGDSEYYVATTFYFEELGVSQISNLLLNEGVSPISVQMACERPVCVADCVDTGTTALYTQGLSTAGLLLWDDFKVYAIDDLNPDYEIP